jgi:exopolysaccharide biosynthesis polyprenyl glycosylphosphotransferase
VSRQDVESEERNRVGEQADTVRSPIDAGSPVPSPVTRARRRADFVYHRLLALSDVAAIVLAAALAFFLAGATGRTTSAVIYVELIALMIPVWMLIAYFAGLYHQVDYRIGHDLVDELGPVLVAITAWVWLFVAVRLVVSDETTDLGRPIFLWVVASVLLLTFRALVRTWARRRAWSRRAVATIGDGPGLCSITDRIKRHPEWCLDIVVEVHSDPEDTSRYSLQGLRIGSGKDGAVSDPDEGRPVPVSEEQMVEYLIANGVERAIVSGGPESLGSRSRLIRRLADRGIAIDHVVGGPETLYSSAHFQTLEGLTVMSIKPADLQPLSRRMKRVLDILVAAVVLTLSSPALAAAALWIRIDSPGPVLFRQARAGLDAEPFEIFKLRTMCHDADEMRDSLRRTHGIDAGKDMLKLENDPRITRPGQVLRRWSVDELPQLINVLKGEMSLVGPRPLPLDEAPLIREEFKLREKVRPGITGPWQVMGRSDIPAEDMLRLDYSYVSAWSFAEDLKLLLRTALTVLGGRGVR